MQADQFDIQLVISDGLNAIAIMDNPVRQRFLATLAAELERKKLRFAVRTVAFERGRVRAGYKVGELLFAGSNGPKAIIHVIGERPGSGHDCFSAYMTVADAEFPESRRRRSIPRLRRAIVRASSWRCGRRPYD
jgi:ethanolamine ammonia-lyase large subunit